MSDRVDREIGKVYAEMKNYCSEKYDKAMENNPGDMYTSHMADINKFLIIKIAELQCEIEDLKSSKLDNTITYKR